MKLIFIYGPPASGKLTIARLLAKRTGYKLLHNHQTFDFLEPVFGAHHEKFPALLNRLRLEIVTTAAEAGFDGLIMTHVYGPEEANFIRQLEAAVVSRSGSVNFVRLAPQSHELARRVEHPDRHEFKKIRTSSDLQNLMASWDVTQAVPDVHSLTIDNTELTPQQTAALIERELGL